MTFGSLFAGIGGFDLGFERAGLTCKWQVEIDTFCQKVLAKHWPNVPRHDDVRTFPPSGDWSVDVICGGFPCQDISKAGRVTGVQRGIDGPRSGLWSEYIRVVREIRPRFVIVENTSALLNGGIGRVLGDLAENGFDAEWACIPASAIGAGHIRDRVFILAYANGERFFGSGRSAITRQTPEGEGRDWEWQRLRVDIRSMVEGATARIEAINERIARPDAVRDRNGFPGGVDRRRGCGNAVVPQVAEWIGRRLISETTI